MTIHGASTIIGKRNSGIESKGKGCYHCGCGDHRAKGCPDATCRICGSVGHDAGGCPDKPFSPAARVVEALTPGRTEMSGSKTKASSKADHFKLYKPVKVLSQFVYTSKRRKGKRLLGDFYDFPNGTMAIGRLDADSEGLLLLTRDGKVSARITGRSVDKEYIVCVAGTITPEAVDRMKRGVDISIHGEMYSTLPCETVILDGKPVNIPESGRRGRDKSHGPTSWVSITIAEGKFRQVRKMTAVVGFPTLRLIRVRIGNIRLDGLDVGEVKEIDL